jgi:exosortase/archaeosortase family protein
MVSRVASQILNAAGVPVLCQGNMMTLPGGLNMFVAEACSGMRQLTGFLALTTAVAYLSARPWWYRGILIASSIPIAMTANVIRVMITALIMYFWDPTYASGTWHTVEGLLLMGLGLVILWGECAILGCFAAPPNSSEPVEFAEVPVVSLSGAGRVARRALLPIGVLAFGLAAEGAVDRAAETSRPPLKGELKSLPFEVGNWVGEDRPVDSDVLERSQADDYLNRVYFDRRQPERKLTVWINYSKHGLNMRHSPEVCLPGQGYTRVESQCRTLAVPRQDGEATSITRLCYTQGELVQGVGFWYYVFGEGALEHFVRKLPITSRSSHGRTTRGSGLTVEIFCPGEFDPDGEALREFASALLDTLEPMLPDERAQYFTP